VHPNLISDPTLQSAPRVGSWQWFSLPPESRYQAAHGAEDPAGSAGKMPNLPVTLHNIARLVVDLHFFNRVPEWWNLADALRSGRSGLHARGGSSPPSGTTQSQRPITFLHAVGAGLALLVGQAEPPSGTPVLDKTRLGQTR
jgi:hypothetical protein